MLSETLKLQVALFIATILHRTRVILNDISNIKEDTIARRN